MMHAFAVLQLKTSSRFQVQSLNATKLYPRLYKALQLYRGDYVKLYYFLNTIVLLRFSTLQLSNSVIVTLKYKTVQF